MFGNNSILFCNILCSQNLKNIGGKLCSFLGLLKKEIKIFMKNFEGTPFKDPLKDHSVVDVDRGLFEQVGDNSDYVVRAGLYSVNDTTRGTYSDRLDELDKEARDIENKYLNNVKCFRDIQDSFSINVPVNFVLGKNEKGDRVVYAITDTITGITLDKGNEILDKEVKDDFVLKLEALHVNLIDYLDMMTRKHKTVLIDIIRLEQYVYGSRPNETSKDIYLVDVDLLVSEENEDGYYDRILANILVLANVIHISYEKYKIGNRESLEKLLNLITFLEESIRLEIKDDNEEDFIRRTRYFSSPARYLIKNILQYLSPENINGEI